MEADTRVDMRLDDGVELLGKYKGSGLQESPYLLRRRDGQVVQVSRLLYLIAGCMDGGRHPTADERDPDEIAARVSSSFGQEVTPENVVYLVDKKLRPAGLVADPTGLGTGEAPTKSNPLLALRLRLPVIPERVHRRVTQAGEVLFWPPWIVAAIAGLVLTDAWLVFSQRDSLSAGTRQILFEPHLLLAITALAIVAGAFHEIGHAAAARCGGARPGTMGVGIYLVWPVFYTDLTDAYRLDRRGRLRTDLGGVYFNVVFTLAVAVTAYVTGYRPLLVFLVIMQLETARQFLPFVRLDGYYVVSDLAGVPNLFAYIQPVLVTLLRRGNEDAQRAARSKLDELNPRARRLIKGWVYLTAPVLLVNAAVFLFLAPRLAGSVWASGTAQLQGMSTDGQFNLVGFANGVIALVLLALPLVGMTYVFIRLANRMSNNVTTWWQARPLATATATVALATLVALQVAVEWPETFAEAVQRAQVAQTIDDAHDGDGNTAEVALPMTPAAEAAVVPPGDDAPPDDAVPATTEPTSDERDERPPISWTGTNSSPTSAKPSSTSAPTATSTPTAPTTSSAPANEADQPGTGARPGTATAPRGGGQGNGNGQPQATTTTTRPPATTTTTRPTPNIIVDLLDLLF